MFGLGSIISYILSNPIYLILLIVCIAHIMRTGRDRIWIFVVIFLPVAGAIAYVVIEMLPSLIGARTVQRFGRGVKSAVDPGRELRERKNALEIADTADNKRLLAEAYLAQDNYAEATALYKSALQGIMADDPALNAGLARASFGLKDFVTARQCLDFIYSQAGRFNTPDLELLYARTLEELGDFASARRHYAIAAPSFAGEEARARYAILLQRLGENGAAQNLYQEILDRSRHATPGYRRAQSEWIDIAKRGLEQNNIGQ